ncbi:MAG TPA: patatin-like phospholipase family protein [Bryobacteraceae bacterium]|nr:patatin-like phospholipase family protein [Bryobacteraceae bacterium]
MPVSKENPQGSTDVDEPERDAVCFTAGAAGALFGAGTIHAHLATDRPAPAVVAGISVGALSAVALQRCYRELQDARDSHSTPVQIEAARWRWLRQYVAVVADRPMDVFWDSIPNPSDFLVETNAPPLRDWAPARSKDELGREQMEANRQKYLLTRLGIWFAGLSVSVDKLGRAVVQYVRFKEKYGGGPVGRLLKLIWSTLPICARLISHILRQPLFVREGVFDQSSSAGRPLLGWRLYSAVWILVILLLGLAATFFVVSWLTGLVAVGILIIAIAVFRKGIPAGLKLLFFQPVLASIGLERSVLHNFHLRWRLLQLFGDGPLDATPMPALIVVAPLQTLYRKVRDGEEPCAAQQLWANPKSKIRTVDALTAAMARPGVWPPRTVNKPDFEQWEPLTRELPHDPFVRDVNGEPPSLDLLDGSVVRQNPLPALLQFLRGNSSVADMLERKVDEKWEKCPKPSVHVIYSVPLEGPPGDGSLPEDKANIVDVALASRQLARRRDTRMEVDQVNCITRLEVEVRAAGSNTSDILVAAADEIAPAADPPTDSKALNPLVPDRGGALQKVADGCRRTIEKLYRLELQSMANHGDTVPCDVLLRKTAPRRFRANLNLPISEGLPEVCQHCTKRLVRPEPDASDCPKPPASGDRSLIGVFPDLRVYSQSRDPARPGDRAQPRIVFVLSGGVFRGSFHIGMIGALLQAKIKPDLIAAASVGTLMGGALASMFSLKENGAATPADRESAAFRRLNELVATFENVDKCVALTRTLKEATRDLGIRARQIRLSPAMIQATVQRGTQADPGYAATGAPPALIDAISSFFTIPLTDTTEIARRFVAGQVATAVDTMLSQIKNHSLARLDIRYAVIGSSLLEEQAKKLIEGDGVELKHAQPFQNPNTRIAFLATTTNLGAQMQVMLWDRYALYNRPYDFIQAALSSSAFPAVFAPRRNSDVFPGWGRTDIRYSDGGMFDNLPFLPAIEVLSQVQMDESQDWSEKNNHAAMFDYVVARRDNPDLFLTGALNARPEYADDRAGPFHYFNDISARAWTLADNSKIEGFLNASHVIYRQFDKLVKTGRGTRFKDPDFVRGLVNAGVLPVFPSDKNHLNKTFAFCKTTGMAAEKVLGSIADGCFQTFRTLIRAKTKGSVEVKESLRRLQKEKRIPELEAIKPGTRLERLMNWARNLPKNASDLRKVFAEERVDLCPYFTMRGEAFECPFARAKREEASAKRKEAMAKGLKEDEKPNPSEIYELCSRDAVHGELIEELLKGR